MLIWGDAEGEKKIPPHMALIHAVWFIMGNNGGDGQDLLPSCKIEFLLRF